MFFNVVNITENLHCRLFYENVLVQLYDYLQKLWLLQKERISA